MGRSVGEFVHRRQKLILYSAALASFLLVIQLIFARYYERIVAVLVQEIVSTRINSRYRADFDGAGFVLNQDRLILKDFVLMEEPENREQMAAYPRPILSVPSLDLKIASTWRLVFKKELLVESLKIRFPEINLDLSENMAADDADEKSPASLYTALSENLRSLQVDDFTLSSGRLNIAYKSGRYTLQDLNLHIRDFGLHKSGSGISMGSSESAAVVLDIGSQIWKSADQMESLAIGSLHISTVDSSLSLEDVVYLRNDQNTEAGKIDIRIPTAKLLDLDARAMLDNKHLSASKLFIAGSSIAINPLEIVGNTAVGDFGFDDFLTGFIDSLSIETIQLEPIQFLTHEKINPGAAAGISGQLSARIEGLAASFATADLLRAIRYTSAEFALNDIHALMPDGIHQLRVGEALLKSAPPGQIAVRDINVLTIQNTGGSPVGATNGFSWLLNLSIPFLQLEGNYLEALIHPDKHRLSTLYIENPAIAIQVLDSSVLVATKDKPNPVFLPDRIVVSNGSLSFLQRGRDPESASFKANGLSFDIDGLHSDTAKIAGMGFDRLSAQILNLEVDVPETGLAEVMNLTVNTEMRSATGRKLHFEGVGSKNGSQGISVSADTFYCKGIQPGANLMLLKDYRFEMIGLAGLTASLWPGHNLEVGDLKYNTEDSSLHIYSCQWQGQRFGTSMYHIDASLSDLSLTGFDARAVLDSKRLHAREMRFDFDRLHIQLDKKTPENIRGFGNEGIAGMKEISVGRLIGETRNAMMTVKNGADDQVFTADKIGLDLSALKINQGDSIDSWMKLLYGPNHLQGEYLTAYKPAEGLFGQINRFNYNGTDRRMDMQGLYLVQHESRESGLQRLHISKMSLNGLEIIPSYPGKDFQIGSLLIERPEYSLNYKSTDEKTDTGRDKTVHEPATLDQLSGRVLIDTFRIKKGWMEIPVPAESGWGNLLIPEIDLGAEFLMVALQAPAMADAVNAEQIRFALGNVVFTSSKGLNVLHSGRVIYDTRDSLFIAENLSLTPQCDKYAYAPAVGESADWIRLSDARALVSGVDLMGMLQKPGFNARKLHLQGPQLSVFRDKRIEVDPERYQPLPVQSLQNLDTDIHVDSVVIDGGWIGYQELSAKANAPGEVFFTDLRLRGANISNRSGDPGSELNCSLNLAAKVMGSGSILAEFKFDLKSRTSQHNFRVSLDSMDLTEFNRILSPASFVMVRSGANRSLSMNADLNDESSHGTMTFLYNELKISLLNPETELPKGLGNVISSFFANTFIIQSNNPRRRNVRKGEMYFERDKSKSIFNYWIKTCFSGLIASIGTGKAGTGSGDSSFETEIPVSRQVEIQ